ncbi:MAG TPA: helix-turn-helix domain-containing protein [Nodosilinea sp.]|nr:helix-turn-helix domain-containing protein [Nodosilinea sp.]
MNQKFLLPLAEVEAPKTSAWYLLQPRVERAQQLLQPTNHSIVEIALRCGFNSHSPLSQQFRWAIGTTPSAYPAKGPWP